MRKVKDLEGTEKEDVAECELNSSNNWTYTFKNIPTYNDEGEEIQYIVDEEALDGESLEYYKRAI